MKCTSPRTVGFYEDGKTLCWSPKNASKQYAPFQLPCGKCISCRLESARQTAVRCVHEAQMYENNIFLTLTYSDEHLGSNRLNYTDFQQFIKKLRHNNFQDLLNKVWPNLNQKEQRLKWAQLDKETRNQLYGSIKIGVFCTGEYGDKSKRIHWHALIFNYRPSDQILKYNNSRGDRIFDSKTLHDLWGKGIIEFGDVTFESAGYCARYAAKKLVHGRDGEHDFNPISKRSSRQAIGKAWIEKYWADVFNHGYIVLPGGQKCGIPRYYEKWLREHQPAAWETYVTQKKQKIISDAQEKEVKLKLEENAINQRRSVAKGHQISRNKVRATILKQKFEQLSKHIKI